MTADFLDLDVRPILAGGEDPFSEIMAAIAALKPGQGLRIVAPFRPAPLIRVLESKGYSHEESPLGGTDWEVIFSAPDAPVAGLSTAPAAAPAWPGPVRDLDVRDLDPPEPMVRILAAIEEMAKGEVLSVVLGREPLFLLPELAKRGHAWRGDFEGCKAYRLLIRVGEGTSA
jgi:uncharacterized protein (DUF2249 family)